MSAIVFGSAEAAARLRIDQMRDELEQMAKKKSERNYWLPAYALSAHQCAIAEFLCQHCGWEKADDSEDGIELVAYRPPASLCNEWTHERILARIDAQYR